jgi:hypothetical protein
VVSYLGFLLGILGHRLPVSLPPYGRDHSPTRTNSEGGAAVFQITLHKNLNAYHRIEGVPNHASIHVKPRVEIQCVPLRFRLHSIQLIHTLVLGLLSSSHTYIDLHMLLDLTSGVRRTLDTYYILQFHLALRVGFRWCLMFLRCMEVVSHLIELRGS